MSSNSGLAQDSSVIVDKSYMVAERFSEPPLTTLFPTRFASPSAAMFSAEDFVGIPGYGPNVARAAATQAANEQTADNMALMMAAAFGARVTINYGGQVFYYVYDKARKVFKLQKPSFEDVVEIYQLSANASLQLTPVETPEKKEETPDKGKETEDKVKS